MSNYTRYPDPASGIKIYPSVVDFPANPGKDGVQAVAADTNTIYIFDTATNSWQAVANPGAAIAIDGLKDDVSATGPGVVSATVNSVGGAAAADIASATADVLAATDLATPSTLVKRDASADSAFNRLKIGDGTALAPSLAFSNSLSTGLYSSAANTLNFATNGAEQMVITSAGSVGIGTSSPNSKVQINNSGTQLGFSVYSTSTNNTAELYNQGTTNYTLALNSAANSALTGASIGGYFARGTLSARAQTLSGDSLLSITASGHTGSAFAGISGGIVIAADQNTGAAAYGGQLVFLTTPNNTVGMPLPRMVIKNDGKVGINNLLPSEQLDVVGSVKANSLKLNGATSGIFTLNAADVTTSYSVKMPAAQGAASTFLQNDGSGSLSWAAVPSPYPSQTGNNDKVLATDGTSTSWNYAGRGAGNLGTGNIILGIAKPAGLTGTGNSILSGSSSALTSGIRNTLVGFDAGPALTTHNNNTVIGNAAGRDLVGDENTIVGAFALASNLGAGVNTSANTVALGSNAGRFGVHSYSVIIGPFSHYYRSMTNSVAIGGGQAQAVPAVSVTGAIMLGYQSIAGSNEMAVGSAGAQINTVYFGRGGDLQTTANAVKIMTMKASGNDTDLSTGTLTLAGSQSTGNKAGGDVIISTAPAGTSGSSLNAHVEIMRVTAAKQIKLTGGGLLIKSLHAQTGTANVIAVVISDTYVGVDTSANSKTVNLPAASAAGAGKFYIIKDESGNAAINNITLTANGADVIDGAGSYTLNTNYESLNLVCDGASKWFIT